MNFVFHGDRFLLEDTASILKERDLVEEFSIKSGQSVEAEKLSFELKDVASLSGIFTAGIKAFEIAGALFKGKSRSKTPTLELRTPRGRIELDLTGKSQKEISDVLKAAYPFLE